MQRVHRKHRLVGLIALVLMWALIGCVGTQTAAPESGPGSRNCPRWQSYANCAKNH